MNSREIATVTILGGFILFVAINGRTRSSLMQVARAFFAPKVFLPLLCYGILLGLTIRVAEQLGLWTTSLLTDTLFWFGVTGLTWYFSLDKASRDPRYFRHRLIEVVGLAACFEFFINLEVLLLPLEFLLQLSIIVLSALRVVAVRDEAYRQVRRLVDVVLTAIVLSLIIWTIYRAISTWDVTMWPQLWRQFALPVWLAFASAPMMYLVALAAGYESLFIVLRFQNDRRRPRARALVGVAAGLRGSLVDIASFRGRRAHEAARATTFSDGRGATAAFKFDRQQARLQRLQAEARLRQHAGVSGVDSDGRLLDRREFAATKAALRRLAVGHMGWYRQQGRYRVDLAELFGDFYGQGLPQDHGVISNVRRDGQAWYAYRQTASGHYFAIGGRDGPPSQWIYDSDVPPSGFPSSQSAGWSDDLREQRLEWLADDAVP